MERGLAMRSIYLDNAATSFPKPAAVVAAMQQYAGQVGASPGRASDRRARKADKVINNVRELLAKLFNVPRADHLCFSTNATSAINTVIKGALRAGDHVVVTAYEHNAVLRPLERLSRSGVISYTVVSPQADSLIHASDIHAAMKPHTRLVIVNHASNVNGAVAPLAEIA